MAVLEKISGVMQQNEVMKKVLRKSMLMLMLEWKSFEEFSDLTTKCFQQCFNELEVGEKHLSSVQESVVESSQELDLIRESVEQRRKEVEGKEEEFCAFRDREIRDLECKWKDLILGKQEFDVAVKLREKMGERLLGELEFEHKQLENLGKSVGNSFTQISMKEKEFEEHLEKLNKIQISIHEESDALQLKERKFAEDFQVKENILHSREKEVETKVRTLHSEENRLDTVMKELRAKEHKLDSTRKELREEVTMLTKKLQGKTSNLDSVKKQLTIKDHHLTSMKKELEHKDKCLGTTKNKLELQALEMNFA